MENVHNLFLLLLLYHVLLVALKLKLWSIKFNYIIIGSRYLLMNVQKIIFTICCVKYVHDNVIAKDSTLKNCITAYCRVFIVYHVAFCEEIPPSLLSSIPEFKC